MTESLGAALLVILPLFGAGFVAWGQHREQIGGLRRDIDQKATKELVEHQYAEIIARLDRIERCMSNTAR